MRTQNYRGYTIKQITHNTYGVTTPAGISLDLWGHYPRTWKAARQLIDTVEGAAK